MDKEKRNIQTLATTQSKYLSDHCKQRKGDILGELNYGSSSISDLVFNKNLSI